MSTRFEVMQRLLDQGKYFKLVCGAGNENAEEVKRLTLLYTLGGAKGMDVSAKPNVVEACMQGIDIAFSKAKRLGVDNLKTRPFITVSVGMPGDHHVRKAIIDLGTCIKCNLCIKVCPTDAIPQALVVIDEKCIGCGNCSAICPVPDVIDYKHNDKELRQILPKCLSAGAEHIELHAAVAEDDLIMQEWNVVSEVNPKNHISMCLDRLHLSDFALEARITKAKAVAKERLIIQADGFPMSGGKDDFNTTLQAIATADVINKRFNKVLNKKTRQAEYLPKQEVNILLSGGTNSLTGRLAHEADVKFHGISIGTFARKIVKDCIEREDFYDNDAVLAEGAKAARKLVHETMGEINE